MRKVMKHLGVDFIFWSKDGHGGFCVQDKHLQYVRGDSHMVCFTDVDVAWVTQCAEIGALGVQSPEAGVGHALPLLEGDRGWRLHLQDLERR